jgi:hypothetical protein
MHQNHFYIGDDSVGARADLEVTPAPLVVAKTSVLRSPPILLMWRSEPQSAAEEIRPARDEVARIGQSNASTGRAPSLSIPDHLVHWALNLL